MHLESSVMRCYNLFDNIYKFISIIYIVGFKMSMTRLSVIKMFTMSVTNINVSNVTLTMAKTMLLNYRLETH